MAFGTYRLGSSPPVIVLLYLHVSDAANATNGTNATNATNAMNAAATERMVHASPTNFFRANHRTVPRRKVTSVVAGIVTAIDWRGDGKPNLPMDRHITPGPVCSSGVLLDSFWRGLVYPVGENAQRRPS